MRVSSLLAVAVAGLIALGAASPAPSTPRKIVRATIDIRDMMTSGDGMTRLRGLNPATPVRVGKTALPAYVLVRILASKPQAAAPRMRGGLRFAQTTVTVLKQTGGASHRGSPPPNFKTGTERIPMTSLYQQLEASYDTVKLPPQQPKATPSPYGGIDSLAPDCGATLCASFADGHDIAYALKASDYEKGPDSLAPFAKKSVLERNPDGSYVTAPNGNCYLDTGDPLAVTTSEVACPGTTIQVPSPACISFCAPQHFHITISHSWFFDYFEGHGACSNGFKIIPKAGKDDGVAHTLYLEIAYPNPAKYSAFTSPLTCALDVFIKGPAGSEWMV